MRFPRYRFGLLIASLMTTTACGIYLGPLDPTTGLPAPIKITGEVVDDACIGPDVFPGQRCMPVGDVRVEVVDGPDKGKAAMTGPDGRFDLGAVAVEPVAGCSYCAPIWPTLLAIRAGWSADVLTASGNASGTSIVLIRMGQAPHILSGHVSLSGSATVMIPGVRVEIIGGPDAGKTALTNASGLYRFDDLATQEQVTVEFSKEGYVTARSQRSKLIMNAYPATVQLQPKPGMP